MTTPNDGFEPEHDPNAPCPICGDPPGRCDHLLVCFDYQGPQILSGLLWDNPDYEMLIDLLRRGFATEHLRRLGRELHRVADDLSEAARQVKEAAPRLKRTLLTNPVKEVRALLAIHGLTKDVAEDPPAFESSPQLMALWNHSRWDPFNPEEPVELSEIGAFDYFAEKLREMGAVGEKEYFHPGQVGMTTYICTLHAENPAFLIDRLPDVVAADLEGGFPVFPVDPSLEEPR